MVGLFLGPDQPDEFDAPETLDFSEDGNVLGGLNYLTLAPELQQLFFIGDGQTDEGVQQEITVPEGATRLYLGTTDGYGWYNNSGFFDVRVTELQGLPNWTIFLDGNRNGILDEGEQSTTTDENGDYGFENSMPGTYVVSELGKPGWIQTLPVDETPHTVTVGSGETVVDVNFENTQTPDTNTSPMFRSQAPEMAVAQSMYQYLPTVHDPDGDALTFDLPLAS